MQERPTQARLRIHFLVIGTTAAGLASAIALRRAGHRVTVLDVEDQIANTWGENGCIIPPSMSKLLLRWLPEEHVRELSVCSRAMLMTKFESEEVLGLHSWLEELFRDAGGNILYMHYADVRQLLFDSALSYGATIRPQARITSVMFGADGRPSVRLASGEAIEADVVVGTDGPESVLRRHIAGADVKETALGMSLFSIPVPRTAMEGVPELRPLLERTTSHSWLGSARGAVGHIAGVRPEYALQVYVPAAGTEAYWGKRVTPAQILEAMGGCEPRLKKLVELSAGGRCVPLTEPPELETWVHPGGRLILIGDAAHPFPQQRGSVNGLAASVCDAAALGGLFRHLHHAGQVEPFLHALEAIRREPVRKLLETDLESYAAIAMPPGAAHELRYRMMKEKHAAGVEALVGSEPDDVVAAHWEKEKDMYAYDAEDHAAEWWNDWGLLQERAMRQACVVCERVPICEIVTQSIVVL
ncbi:uncharacterized protein PHACADRAFT_162446 [Phanerochaete carnosa HHB-10118-sp]|uniref:FAD-binding domain-containing protein n=1 Tax=Phanerochaete carnosa (strain HHB-10118-sp) TaxID=650164 RepID=K5W4H6_PHACS|nr:uncharacterized protein PHACADRAFT_162446 [Phanerochaete carnosa HHB-10118-sp]EKM54065.1 hypothetical protein PHACADRAFT_162446 [Phanerochaete carnosa HHB-10118-sp]